MAIDTAEKRCSAIATRRLPWFRRFAPIPDGTVDAGDRQQVAFVYRGILASAPVTISGLVLSAYGRDDSLLSAYGKDDSLLASYGRDDSLLAAYGDEP